MPAGYDRDSHRLPEGANQANVGSRLGFRTEPETAARDRDRENANTGGASWHRTNGELWLPTPHTRGTTRDDITRVVLRDAVAFSRRPTPDLAALLRLGCESGVRGDQTLPRAEAGLSDGPRSSLIPRTRGGVPVPFRERRKHVPAKFVGAPHNQRER